MTTQISFKIPFYAKVALIIISVVFFILALYVGQHIIVPILYAAIIAILLNPLVNYLVRKKVPRIISISFAVVLAIFVAVGILYILYSRIAMLSETYPQLKEKFNATSLELVRWTSKKFSIRQSKINAWTKETQSDAIGDFEIAENLKQIARMMMVGVLLPVYLFMILYYKELLLEFIRRLFRSEHQVAVAEVLTGTKKIIQSYLVGLFVEMGIIAILNAVGFLILGLEYAIVLGITIAILNIIPYIGGIIGIILPMIIAFVTKDSLTYPILVFLICTLIQFIDNHYIIPNVVASRVQINALISVIVVLMGSALWGVSGMFISIPLTAIIKVIFDHIEPLKPWGFLLGNVVPTTARFSFINRKTKD